jgi:septum formation protein
VSGLALLTPGNPQVVHEVTNVTFRALPDELVRRYVKTGEWSGRAGGYAIQEQGAALVRSISGDYLNVVGLPLGALLDLNLSLILSQR